MTESYFYAPDIMENPVLPEDESLHCTRVLRLKNGDTVTITDGKGFLCEAMLEAVNPKQCKVEILRRIKPEKTFEAHIHIAVAPTKNIDRMEWFVEKATEMGINEITFLKCEHSERKDINLLRINKIAVSAMKQSQKAFLPDIREMIDFKTFINRSFQEMKMIAHCENTERKPMTSLYAHNSDALVLIGPEGDFSKEEINQAINADFIPVSLGNSRLRTETAALVACNTIHIINQITG
jgi:16S rRNA (uracil1498-N3)-methyltransferase